MCAGGWGLVRTRKKVENREQRLWSDYARHCIACQEHALENRRKRVTWSEQANLEQIVEPKDGGH